MKSIFLVSVAFCVLLVAIKDVRCKSLGSIEKKSIVTSKDSDNVTREVTSNNLYFLVSDEVLRTKRDIMNNIGCPFNMRRVITCVPISNLRHGRHGKRKHGQHKNKKF